MTLPGLGSGAVFLGHSFRRGNPEPWVYFEVPYLLINAFDFVSRMGGDGNRDSSASQLLRYPGFVLCDSGGYQVLQGDQDVDIRTIINTQRALKPDLLAMLDHGNDLETHLRNLAQYVREFGSEFMPIVPLDMPPRGTERFDSICEGVGYSTLGVGKFVPLIRPPTHYAKVRGAFRRLAKLRRRYPDVHLHLFGVGGLYTGLMALLFVDSIDTSSWIHDARFWKVRILGGGVFSTRASHSTRRKVPIDLDCGCPTCSRGDLREKEPEGMPGFRSRAVHNAWVVLEEYRQAGAARAQGALLDYVRERVDLSPIHRKLFAELGGLAIDV